MEDAEISLEDAEISIFEDLAVQPVDSSVLAISVAKFLCDKDIIFSIHAEDILIVFSYPIAYPTYAKTYKNVSLV